MRISDWSSDVCSSDLLAARTAATHRQVAALASHHARAAMPSIGRRQFPPSRRAARSGTVQIALRPAGPRCHPATTSPQGGARGSDPPKRLAEERRKEARARLTAYGVGQRKKASTTRKKKKKMKS